MAQPEGGEGPGGGGGEDGGGGPGGEDGEGRYPPASRRTYFAEERTFLAWWRTGIAAAAVSLGVGGLVPRLGDLPKGRFLALGAAYGALALFFVVGGTVRARRSGRALEHGAYAAASWTVVVLVTVYTSVLIVLTVVALF
ncbi:MAG TPA: DUF202 domain-containing protein [Acidimicrobiales bacterium]|nr:DUF202 domain-containing protein [Acidimicrobiales bacterium]